MMLLKKSNNGNLDEANLHPHDLLSAQIRDEYTRKVLTSGIMID